MSFLSRITDRFKRDREARDLTESDAPADLGTARTRATGGRPEPGAEDRHSTTGTTPSETFVGRVSGDETGADETSGAERRAGQDSGGSGQGAASRRGTSRSAGLDRSREGESDTDPEAGHPPPMPG